MIDMARRREYNKIYKVENYDQMLVRVKKGKRREYQKAAADLGMSCRELVQRSVEEFIARHKAEALAQQEKGE